MIEPGQVLVIVPAYNEERSLGSTLSACLNIVPARDIVVVDDGSVDQTAAVARSMGVRCLRLPINLGIGGAVQTGYHLADREGYAVAVQLDGDGQHDPADLERVIAPVLAGECELAIGSRYLQREGFQSSRIRRFGIWLLSRLIYASTGRRVRDCTSGFRAAGAAAIKQFVEYYPADYPEPESLALVMHSGLRVSEVPVAMRARQEGRSSIRAFDAMVYMTKLFMLVAIYWTFSKTLPARQTR